jgi:2-succinyl-6-hydroxy-2,4-cyclohexadiene-1-carboxylate synthase
VTRAFLHGFAGDPAVWDGIGAPAIALPPVQPTWQANLDAIAAQLGKVDLVIGYSLGARLALGLVASGYVPRAILISVNPGIDDHERPARRANDARWAAMLRTQGIAAFLDAWEAQPLFATQPRDPGRRARRLRLDPEQLARSLETMGLAEMPDYRAQLDGRCSLVTGALDAKFCAIAAPYPHVEIAGSGHDPLLEQPAALARALRELGA